MRLEYVFAVVLLLSSISHAVVISEIMFDFQGSDTGHEWVEIYNNENVTYNLTDWKLNTGGVDHGLSLENVSQSSMILIPGAYAVIAQDPITFLNDYPGYNETVINVSGMVLPNSEETVILKNNTIFDNITYPDVTEGKTACLLGNWTECEPTPGQVNRQYTVTTDASLALFNLSVAVNETVSNLFQISIENCTAEDITVNYTILNVTNTFTVETNCTAYGGNWTHNETGSYEVCGELFRNESNTTNNAVCGNINVSEIELPSEESYITITNVDKSSVVFGDDFDVTLDIYRNATAKYAVYVSIPGISDTTTYHATPKNSTHTVTLPVRLKPNCDGAHGNGVYTILAEGLDKNSTASITVSGLSSTYCQVQVVSSGSSGGGGGSTYVPPATSDLVEKYEIKSYPESVFVDDEFEVVVEITSPDKKDLEVYSYVYKGVNPVSLGFDGSTWKGTWNANKKEIVINNNKMELVLKNKIELGTEAGDYTLRVKINGDKEYEITRTINVAGDKPKINVEGGTVSTNCDDCEILILGPDTNTRTKQHTLVSSGTFYLVLLKDSKVLSVEQTVISVGESENTDGTTITGFAVKKQDLRPYINFLKILSLTDLF